MSNDALNAVWAAAEGGEFDGLGTGPLFVLIVLADEGAAATRGDDWTCFPAVKTIQKRTAMGRSTVERHLRALAEAGWISRECRLRENGAASSNLYTIHRSPELRLALSEGRRAIIAGGGVPTDTILDLDHPRPNLGGYPPTKSGGYYPPKSVHPPSQFGGEPPPDLGEAYIEPLDEPLDEPSGARTACAASEVSSAKGLPRRLPLIPRELFDQVRRSPGGDPRACDAYLRYCYWDETTRALHPATKHAAATIERDLRRPLRDCGLVVGEPIPGLRQ